VMGARVMRRPTTPLPPPYLRRGFKNPFSRFLGARQPTRMGDRPNTKLCFRIATQYNVR